MMTEPQAPAIITGSVYWNALGYPQNHHHFIHNHANVNCVSAPLLRQESTTINNTENVICRHSFLLLVNPALSFFLTRRFGQGQTTGRDSSQPTAVL